MSHESDFVLIGLLRRAHGLGGEICVEAVSDIPERFQALEYALLRGGNGRTRQVWVEAVRRQGKLLLIKLRGIDDRSAAQDLGGAELGVRRKDVYPVPEGTYYVFDLVGCKVKCEDGREIGVVTDILKMPANDVLVVASGGREILIPSVRSVVKRIDLEAQTIVIEDMDGLLD